MGYHSRFRSSSAVRACTRTVYGLQEIKFLNFGMFVLSAVEPQHSGTVAAYESARVINLE